MYARFVEIYAVQFKSIDAMLRATRCEIAAQIVKEYPESNDARELAEHLKRNTPGKWLEDWDLNVE